MLCTSLCMWDAHACTQGEPQWMVSINANFHIEPLMLRFVNTLFGNLCVIDLLAIHLVQFVNATIAVFSSSHSAIHSPSLCECPAAERLSGRITIECHASLSKLIGLARERWQKRSHCSTIESIIFNGEKLNHSRLVFRSLLKQLALSISGDGWVNMII